MEKQHYNIMTSCDEGLVKYVAINLVAMANNLRDAKIDFYLFHSRIERRSVEMLERLCSKYENMTFHEIVVPDAHIYDELAKYGGGWCGEAYYSMGAHLILPETEDRILYLDAGDVMVVGDISAYYNCDFEGKSLIVTGARYKMEKGELAQFTADDLGKWNDENGLLGILRGIFNSGSYVINLQKLRSDGITLEDYQYFVQRLREINGNENTKIYFGDQGLLSAVFAGDVKYFAYPEIRNLWYMPYNFCMWYYDRMNKKPEYVPSVLHYCGVFKPWKGCYPVFIERFQDKRELHSLRELKIGQAEYFYLWHEWAIITDNILTGMGY